MTKRFRALGLMSGTSMDGIDVALLETDGECLVERLGCWGTAYDPEFRARMAGALTVAAGLTDRRARPRELAEVEHDLTCRHADAVRAFLAHQGLTASAIDVIGFHGQTVLHRPEIRLTVQLGDGPLLARLTGIDVIHDLRAADVAAGGQGAPLVPVYHRALAGRAPERPIVFLNIGGVANVTWIGADGRLVAFDTGPGNALLDDWALRHLGLPKDSDGALARSGTCNHGVLMAYLSHPYFDRPVPKSLDRGDFDLDHATRLSPADGAATLTEVTAATIAKATASFPAQPGYWVVCGGGRRNRFLMERLAWHLAAPVVPAEALVLDGDNLEAEAFAYLAVRSLNGLPLSYPMTTGVPAPQSGGILAKA